MILSLNSLISHLRSGGTSDQKQKGRNGEDESEHFVAKKGEICFSQKVEVATRTVTTSSGLTAQRREQRRLCLLYQLQQLGMDGIVSFKIAAFKGAKLLY